MRVDRLQAMEDYVVQKGSASLEELMAHFSISINTARRDIGELAARGQLKKVYGGVTATTPQGLLPMHVRAQRQQESKQRIGLLAAPLVPDNATVFLDSGSTTVCVIPHLAARQGVTLITHSLSALYEAAKYPTLNTIALGGQYSQPTASYVGASTLDVLSRMTIDIVLIAATGVSLEQGLTNTTYFEAELKRSVTARSRHIVLMADHTKFGKASLFSFCPLEHLHTVVTDAPPTDAYRQFFQAHDIGVVCDAL